MRIMLRGFTLIELLIVVAIIAILAAIAVPNFLEAQTRAKVSRARTDMRTVATALEAYRIDFNHYPPNPDAHQHFYVVPDKLTTPIAYLTSRPEDPFKANKDVSRGINIAGAKEDQIYDSYTIVSTDEYVTIAGGGTDLFVVAVDASGALAGVANQGAFKKYGGWLLWSIGPDAQFWNAADDFNNPLDPTAGLKPPAHLNWGYSFDVGYDPTNGTVSFGNIIRTQVKADGTMAYVP